jgi:hypothetical protein
MFIALSFLKYDRVMFQNRFVSSLLSLISTCHRRRVGAIGSAPGSRGIPDRSHPRKANESCRSCLLYAADIVEELLQILKTLRRAPTRRSDGLRFRRSAEGLGERGALPPPNAKGEYAKTVRIPGVKPSRLYEINPEKLEHGRS